MSYENDVFACNFFCILLGVHSPIKIVEFLLVQKLSMFKILILSSINHSLSIIYIPCLGQQKACYHFLNHILINYHIKYCLMEYRFTKLANFKNINIGFLHASDLGFLFFLAKLAFKSENLFHFEFVNLKKLKLSFL